MITSLSICFIVVDTYDAVMLHICVDFSPLYLPAKKKKNDVQHLTCPNL